MILLKGGLVYHQFEKFLLMMQHKSKELSYMHIYRPIIVHVYMVYVLHKMMQSD